jgi:PIN domain nuclease of toxin-antitoxin system
MIILDTCILIFDNLTPERLSKVALEVLEIGETMGQLCCSDISLWEIAMLEQKRRIIIATDYLSFMQSVLKLLHYPFPFLSFTLIRLTV